MIAAAPQFRRRAAVLVGGKGIPRPVYYLLAITLTMFIASNAFASTFTTVMNTAKWLPLCALLAASANSLVGRRLPECPPSMLLWLGSFFVLTFASAYFGILGLDSIGAVISVAIVVLAGYAAAAVIISTDSRREFFDLIAILGRILVGTALLFYLARINLGRGTDFAAWVDNPNTLAAILAPGCIVFIAGCIERRRGWLYLHLPFLVIGIPLMIVSQGRASELWVLLSLIAFWVYRRGSWPLAAVLMIASIILIGWWGPISKSFLHWAQLDITPQQATGIGPLSGREEVWQVGVQLFRERPIFGYGMGSSIPLIHDQAWRFVRFQGAHFHSSYIMLLVETGFFGFVLFMAGLVSTISRGVVDARRKRVLPRDSWPTAALPFAMFVGMIGHAIFESWLIAGGNVSSPLFWIVVWMIHFQGQVGIRRVRAAPPAPA